MAIDEVSPSWRTSDALMYPHDAPGSSTRTIAKIKDEERTRIAVLLQNLIIHSVRNP
jgi:hypothetical protein